MISAYNFALFHGNDGKCGCGSDKNHKCSCGKPNCNCKHNCNGEHKDHKHDDACKHGA